MKLNKLELQIEKNKGIKQVLFTANFCYNAFKCHIHECINCQGIVFIEKSVQGHFCTTWSPQDLVFCVEVFLMVWWNTRYLTTVKVEYTPSKIANDFSSLRALFGCYLVLLIIISLREYFNTTRAEAVYWTCGYPQLLNHIS